MVSELISLAVDARVGFDVFERLRGLSSYLGGEILGQEHVLPRVCSVLIRGELGLANPNRPRGSFLFVGPTGVGKTETFNAFTSYLFSGAKPIRFDMSEYQLQGSVEKLIGEHREDRGLLGRALFGLNHGTLLFDEIEKAHPLVLDLFLQVLEDARITLATGETLDLRGFYPGFTSNIGTEETIRMENAPFSSVERTVLMRVRERLRPELVGRITEVIVFARLDYVTQRAVCEALIRHEITRLVALGFCLETSSDAVEFLVRVGYHRSLGARPMRAAVERFLQEAVVESLLKRQSGKGVLVPDETSTRLVLRP